VKSVHGHLNWSLPCLPLHIHAEDIIPTFLTSNIYVTIWRPEAPTLKRCWSYEMFEVLLIVIINKCMGLQGILNFRLLRDAFPYRLARGIPRKEGDPYALQSKVRTPPPHVRRTFLTLQISINACPPLRPLHSGGQ